MSNRIHHSSRTQSSARENKTRHSKVRQVRGKIPNPAHCYTGESLKERAVFAGMCLCAGLIGVCVAVLFNK